MSIFKLVVIGWLLGLSVLAWVLYTPLPEGMEDPIGASIAMAVGKLILLITAQCREFLGQGSYLNNLRAFQMTILREGDINPLTSWFGELNVTRATIAGLPVILYRHWDDADAPLRPGFIYFPGGGWILASSDAYDMTVYEFALCTGSVTISVDYRRAPQHRFPAAFDDAVEVTRHILRHGHELGIDVTRVGVAGDSTGGNLAAAAALHLASTTSDLPPLKYQTLICPVLQGLNYRLPSYEENGVALPTFTVKHAGAFASIYLGLDESKGDHYGDVFSGNMHVSYDFRTNSKYAQYINESNLPGKYRRRNRASPMTYKHHDESVFQRIKDLIVDPRFSPLMADDLSGLPSTHIVVQKFDVVRDDGLLYAKRLRDFGVEATVHDGNGFHIDHLKFTPRFLQSKTGLKAVQSICKFVKRVVKEPTDGSPH